MNGYDTETSEINCQFSYPAFDDPLFAELKTIAAINIDPVATELEKAKIIIGYAHGLFNHDSYSQPSSIDPLTIIKEAQSGKSFRCVEYSLLATALLWAHGIPARMIGLKTSDVETRPEYAGHVMIEFWSDDFKKWVMCDVQAGLIITALGPAPLSALELGLAISQDKALDALLVAGSKFGKSGAFKDTTAYKAWISEYLYFFDTPQAITFSDVNLQKQKIVMLVPLHVKSPKLFQNMFTMNALYTHSIPDFYPAFSFSGSTRA